MTDITKIKRMLADKAQGVAEMLLPNGKKINNEWRVGSIRGEPGQSLGVHLSGEKAGVWADFEGGQRGDLLDLWCAIRGVGLSEAIEQSKKFLGILEIEPYRKYQREYIIPPKPKCVPVRDKALNYLTEVRKIPFEVLDAFKIGSTGDNIIFPFLKPDGTLAMAKSRKAEDGEKPKPTMANCEPILFGWQTIPEGAREVIISEGEVDALSWYAYGGLCLSVPFGGGSGGKQNWIESEFERLQRFEKIYLSTDMDEPGEQAAREISSRLGRHRCFRVRLPYKDANECLMKDVPKSVMEESLRNAESYLPDGLRRVMDYADAVKELFWPEGKSHLGYVMPYEQLARKLYFRPGEVSLWTGPTGSGKSQVILDCCVDWIQQGSRICLASLEMKPAISLKRMVKQAGGVDRPVEEFIHKILEFIDNGLYLYGHVGKQGLKVLLEVFDFAKAKYGCDQFVIDSLMRLGYATDDYNGMEEAVYELVNWAVTNDVHVHLVAHARKSQPGSGITDGEDVKGPMELIANAANIIAVWRNRKLEDDLSAEKDPYKIEELKKKPGVVLNVAKQRNGDFEGKVGLWFNQQNYRYRSSTCPVMGRSYVSLGE